MNSLGLAWWQMETGGTVAAMVSTHVISDMLHWLFVWSLQPPRHAHSKSNCLAEQSANQNFPTLARSSLLIVIKFFCYCRLRKWRCSIKKILWEKIYQSQLQFRPPHWQKKETYIKIVSSTTRAFLSLFSILLAISLSIEQFRVLFRGQDDDIKMW